MAKYAHPDIMDLGLSQLSTTATRIYAIEGFTSDFAAVSGANKIGQGAIGESDITLADAASGGGRKAVVGPDIIITIDADGTPDHLAIVDATPSGSERVLYVTDITNQQPVLQGNTMTTPQWEIQIDDPNIPA